LTEKNLLKDISIEDVSCDSDETYVKVVKLDDSIGYYTSIGCGKKDVTGNVHVDTLMPENRETILDSCNSDVRTIISFEATPVPSGTINYQRRNLTVKMTSHTGFHEDIKISYAFTTDGEGKEKGIVPNSVLDGWHSLNVNYVGGNDQKKKIAAGESISLSSNPVTTPANITNRIYLVLKIENLKDLSGRNWTNEQEKGSYIYFGTYIVDNSKPVFSDSSTVLSTEEEYHSVIPKLNINVTDNDLYSNIDNLKMCISYDTDTCPKTLTGIRNNSKYEKYDGTKILPKIQDAYDGSDHSIYVTVADAAGNYTTKSFAYKLATRYTLTYDANGGSACDPTKKSVVFDTTAPAWGELCTTTRTKYNFIGWNTQSDGKGTNITKDTIADGNLTVYAKWKLKEKDPTYVFCYFQEVEAKFSESSSAQPNDLKDPNSYCQLERSGKTYNTYDCGGVGEKAACWKNGGYNCGGNDCEKWGYSWKKQICKCSVTCPRGYEYDSTRYKCVAE